MQVRGIEALKNIYLKRGAHAEDSGNFCAMELAALIAREKHSDHPQCVDHLLTTLTICMNDTLSDSHRQKLKDYIPRMIDTRNDGREKARIELFKHKVFTRIVPIYLKSLLRGGAETEKLRVLADAFESMGEGACKLVLAEEVSSVTYPLGKGPWNTILPDCALSLLSCLKQDPDTFARSLDWIKNVVEDTIQLVMDSISSCYYSIGKDYDTRIVDAVACRIEAIYSEVFDILDKLIDA